MKKKTKFYVHELMALRYSVSRSFCLILHDENKGERREVIERKQNEKKI